MSPTAEKSQLPITTRSTRRRPIDSIEVVEEEDEDGGGGGGDYLHHPFHHRSERAVVGCCAMLRRKMNSLLRVLRPGRKNLSRWIFGAFMLLIVSTIFFKLMLIYSFLEYSSVAHMKRRDFLIRPTIVMNNSDMHQNVVQENKDNENGGDHGHEITYPVRFSFFHISTLIKIIKNSILNF